VLEAVSLDACCDSGSPSPSRHPKSSAVDISQNLGPSVVRMPQKYTKTRQLGAIWKIPVASTFIVFACFDVAGALVVASLGGQLVFGFRRLAHERTRVTFYLWLCGFFARVCTAIMQSGHALILENPQDSLLYESRGRIVAGFPITEWASAVRPYSLSTRGIVILHALVDRYSIFRPAIHVAMLSVASSTLALCLVFQHLCVFNQNSRTRVLFISALALSPPFVFWTSQNTKEGFVLLGLTLFGLGVARSKMGETCLGLALSTLFRPYLGVLLVCSAFAGWGLNFGFSNLPIKMRTKTIWLLGLVTAAGALGSALLLTGDVATGREGYAKSAILAGGRSLDNGVARLGPSSLLLTFVRSVITPPPWYHPVSIFHLVSVVEGTFVAILLISTVLTLFRRSPYQGQTVPILAISVLVICLAYGQGLNIGTTVRLRTTFYPLLVIFAVSSNSFHQKRILVANNFTF
jgi:hypothetical protein